MCGKMRIGVLLPAAVLAWPTAGIYTAVAAEPRTHRAGGRVAGCEHFTFQRAKVAEETLLLYEHAEAIDRQVIEGRILRRR